MDENTLAKYMLKTAKREVFGGKGRIFLPDFLADLPVNPKPTPEYLMEVWRKLYPKITIERPTQNVLLLYIGGNVCAPRE